MKNEIESMSEREMTALLVDMARNSGSDTARIQAMKLLRDIGRGEVPLEESFRSLYEVKGGKAGKTT